MRKLIFIIIAAAALITALLYAAGWRGDVSSPDTPPKDGDDPPTPDYVDGQIGSDAAPLDTAAPPAETPPPTETSNPIKLLGTNALSCGGTNGFWYMTLDQTKLKDGSYGTHLMFIDYASRREVYLCADPSCAHDTADCTSVFGVDAVPQSSVLFTMGDSLYILSREPDMDGVSTLGGSLEASDPEPAVLYRTDLDGTGRERIFTFERGLTVESFVAGDGDGLYFITKRVEYESGSGGSYAASTGRELVYLSLGDMRCFAIESLDADGVKWKPIGCAGRMIVLHGIDFGTEVSPLDKGLDKYDDADEVFVTYNVDTGVFNEIYRVKCPKSRTYTSDGESLYFSADGGPIVAVDLTSGETRELCAEAPGAIYGTVGGYLYTDDSDNTLWFIDTATGDMSHCGLKNRTVGSVLRITAVSGGTALVNFDTEVTWNEDGSFIPLRQRYGLIAVSDLIRGVDSIQEIEMTETGIC